MNLTVRRGEILGIAGESGCGKSTFASALLRLIRPPGYIAGGRITFFPADRGSTASSEGLELLSVGDAVLRQVRWRNLAYVPQGSMHCLNPVMRIEEQFFDVIREHADVDRYELRRMVPDLLRQ